MLTFPVALSYHLEGTQHAKPIKSLTFMLGASSHATVTEALVRFVLFLHAILLSLH